MAVFQVIPPAAIADANLISSTVPELDTASGEDPAAWNPATDYEVGDLVGLASAHRVYENAIAGVDATSPDAATAATRWLPVGYTNRWRSLYLDNSKPTVADSPYVVELQPNKRANAWFVGGVVADSLTVTMELEEVVIYTVTVPMTRRLTRSWSDYFFGDFENKPADLRFDMPLTSVGVIRFEFTRTAGPVQVSSIVVGRSVELGRALANAESSDLNFSRIDREFDGTAILQRRRLVPKTRQEVLAHVDLLPAIRKLKLDVNAGPAVWSALGSESDAKFFDSFLILGIYREFKINAPHVRHALIQLELEEI